MLFRRKSDAAQTGQPAAGPAKPASPGDAGELARLTSPQSWIVALTLAVATLGAVAWGFLGEVRVSVGGLGIVEYEQGVLQDLTAASAGRLETLSVQVGSSVEEGDVVAVLQVGTDQAELEAAQRELEQLRDQRAQQTAATDDAIARRTEAADALVRSLEEKAAVLQQQIADYGPYLQALEEEMAAGLVLRDRVEQVRNDLNTARVDLATARSDILNARSNLAEFVANQQKALDDLDSQVLQAEDKVRELQAAVAENTQIVAPRAGRIVAIEAEVGDELLAGAPVAQLETPSGSLLTYTYFRPGDGKRIQPGMSALVSPSTVEPEIYGTVLGAVVAVSAQPVSAEELRTKISNETLVQQLLKGGPVIEVAIDLKRDPSTASGLEWTSSVGPPQRVTAGTVASAKVAVQEEPPVAYIVPIFGTWFGGDEE